MRLQESNADFDDDDDAAAQEEYEWATGDEGAGVTLAWRDLCVTATNDGKARRIIECVSGAVRAGSLVAVLGASGAGKTTLMHALAHRPLPGAVVEGRVLVGGREARPADMRQLAGFLHQEDLFVGCLTAEEHLCLVARLRNCGGRRARDVAVRLGVSSAALNTRLNRLSGGERKRVALAAELLTSPPILFCDEPTSGLDSFQAAGVVTALRAVAARGHTVLASIHQPSTDTFAAFGQVLLLASGRVAFFGPAALAADHLRRLGHASPPNCNPADHLVRTLCTRDVAAVVCDHYAVSEQARRVASLLDFEERSADAIVIRPVQQRNVPLHVQAACLIARGLASTWRDPTAQALRLAQKLAIAAMVGLCYLGTDALTQAGVQSVQGVVFILSAENVFSPMYATLPLIPSEMPLLLREYNAGLYSLPVYYVSKMLSIVSFKKNRPTTSTDNKHPIQASRNHRRSRPLHGARLLDVRTAPRRLRLRDDDARRNFNDQRVRGVQLLLLDALRLGAARDGLPRAFRRRPHDNSGRFRAPLLAASGRLLDAIPLLAHVLHGSGHGAAVAPRRQHQ